MIYRLSQSAVAPRTEHVFSEWFACAEIRLRPLCNRRLQGPQTGVAPDWCCSREHSQYSAVPETVHPQYGPKIFRLPCTRGVLLTSLVCLTLICASLTTNYLWPSLWWYGNTDFISSHQWPTVSEKISPGSA